ncbi:MAG: 7-cyano-7-deazaguanine synthase QueC [Phycisphaerales bacterium JB050]
MPDSSSQSDRYDAVVLLSGGLDSATCLAIAKDAGYRCHCLTISYGQRHQAELAAAAAVVESLGATSHKVISIDLRAFGGSALTSDDFEVPKADAGDGELPDAGIPITYVPARNTIFLSYALGYAEVLGAKAIYAGVNAVDYSGYPDCRPEFIAAFQAMADLATKAGVEGHGPVIETPLLHLTKPEIIQRGLGLGVDYGLTHSCYDPVETAEGAFRPCGRCDSCRIRINAFAKLGLADPAVSADHS